MDIDLNIDEFNRLIINKNDNLNKSVTTDNEYWNARNYILNKFYRKDDFWKKYKGQRIRNKIDMEKNIEIDLQKNIKEELKDKIKVVCLILGSRLIVYFFYLSKFVDEKDKILFDFDISL